MNINTNNTQKKKPSFEAAGKKIKSVVSKKNLKKNLIVLASLAIIGGAVYLNWSYFSPSGSADANELKIDHNVVNESDESYFAMTEVSRQRSRDEAMEVLQSIIDNNSAADAERNEALNSISTIAANIESEGNIESLVVSKGFEECVAVISGGNATVVVKSDGLLENEVTQIQEIVYNESGILPENLHIVEKAG